MDKITEAYCSIDINSNWETRSYPWWLGRGDFHGSHRSNLLRKYPEHYAKFGWEEPDNLPYVWPTHLQDRGLV